MMDTEEWPRLLRKGESLCDYSAWTVGYLSHDGFFRSIRTWENERFPRFFGSKAECQKFISGTFNKKWKLAKRSGKFLPVYVRFEVVPEYAPVGWYRPDENAGSDAK